MPDSGSIKEYDFPVIIVGAGPTGLSLALGLAKHGIRSVVLEKKVKIDEFSKAPVIHQRTREIFEQWGIGEFFLNKGSFINNIEVKKAGKDKFFFPLILLKLKRNAGIRE